MTLSTEQTSKAPDMEATVAEYLAANPGFFERHEPLLLELRLPHVNGGSVSLLERQLAALRKECARHQQRLTELVAVGHANDLLIDRLHQMTLALMDTTDLDELLNVLEDQLHAQFKADYVELRLFTPAELENPSALEASEQKIIRHLQTFFQQNQPRCGDLPQEQLEILFGAEAGDIHSAVLIPLKSESISGILAIGSSDRQRFQQDMGTDFLSRLGELVSQQLEVVSEPGA